MTEQILTNARIVLSDEVISGTVAVRGGRIAGVDSGRSSLPGAADLQGDLLIPGLIELHTDNLERHMMPRPQAFWPADAAVLNHDREIIAAGITTVYNALCVGEVHSRSARLQLLGEMSAALAAQDKAGALKADHHIHWRCEVSYGGLIDLLTPLMEHERVGLISVMDHTPGQRQFVQIERYAEYYQGKFGMSDAELQAFIDERIADQKRHSAQNRAQVVAMAKNRAMPLASHDDATADHVAEALRDGMTIAEFPTTAEAARASHASGLAVLMGAPNVVRGGSHSGNVAARDLGAKGVLDILSSDYVPGSLLYGAMLLARGIAGLSLPRAIAMVTRNPARAVGLADRGEIAPELRADLVRVHEGESVPVIREVWRSGKRVA